MASSSRYTKAQDDEPFIECVQIEGLVSMMILHYWKIIMLLEEETGMNDSLVRLYYV